MSGFNPKDFKVHTRQIPFRNLVLKQWGAEWDKKDICYKFSNGRKFESTDSVTSGIYKPR
jgi:hypothetical protein